MSNLDRIIRINTENNIVDTILAKPNEKIELVPGADLTSKQKALLKFRNDLRKHSEELGGYIHMKCYKNKLLFEDLDIDRANISRIIYLSTFIDYNDRQENLLIKYTKNKKIEPLTRAEIKNRLKLGETAFKSFLSDMKKNNLIYEHDKKFYINSDYFNKGNSIFNPQEYTRVFVNTTRFLYENCNSSRQHKQLSYIFQLIPFMNYELNILCSNPTESDFYELDKLNLTQICEILGVSTDRRNMVKLKNELLKFYIQIDNRKYYFLSYVNIQNGFGIKDYFVINPSIAWSGRSTDVVKDIVQTCFF